MIVKNDLAQQLNRIGFSDHEAKVYLALLGEGLSTAGVIIKKTSLHRNIVYETLDKLSAKRLVSESDQRGVKHFRVVDLDRIIKEKENQLDLAKNLVLNLSEIKKSENVEIQTYEGYEGFQTALLGAVNYIQEGHSNLVMGAGGENFYKAMGKELKRYERIRVQRKISSKIIGNEIQRQEFLQGETPTRQMLEIRYLPENFSTPMGTVIFDDKVLLQIYSNPPAVVEIRSREVSKSYKNYFGILWKMARK